MLPGPTSRKTRSASSSSVVDAVGEEHGVAQVLDPVRRGRERRRRRASLPVRFEMIGIVRLVELDARQITRGTAPGSPSSSRECAATLTLTRCALDAVSRQPLRERVERLARARRDRQSRAVRRCDVELVADERRELVGAASARSACRLAALARTSCPRSSNRPSASSNEKTPATQAAVFSPMLWPTSASA